jgi:hypothetical protein
MTLAAIPVDKFISSLKTVKKAKSKRTVKTKAKRK